MFFCSPDLIRLHSDPATVNFKLRVTEMVIAGQIIDEEPSFVFYIF